MQDYSLKLVSFETGHIVLTKAGQSLLFLVGHVELRGHNLVPDKNTKHWKHMTTTLISRRWSFAAIFQVKFSNRITFDNSLSCHTSSSDDQTSSLWRFLTWASGNIDWPLDIYKFLEYKISHFMTLQRLNFMFM